MEFEVGSVLDGKVTGITKFGAFVQLPGGASGLVHISEIANAFVNDVNDFLTMGQSVQVKVISVNEAGKINLSIKQLQQPGPKIAPRQPQASVSRPAAPRPEMKTAPEPYAGELHGPSADASFEDKLRHFMQESDSKMSGNKLYADRRSSNRRRK